MGSTVKPKGVSLYAAMLRLYPRAFQKHYGVTMQQTFDDMLDGEASTVGRLQVWTRTLTDLPFSAAKEYITDGKELVMNRTTKFIIAVAVVMFFAGALGSFWKGRLWTEEHAAIKQVTVAQMADAMQQDHFYSDYGNVTVLFSGRVSAVAQHDGTTSVTFATSRPYSVSCEFSKTTTAQVGQTLSIAATGGHAERQPHGVALHDCVEN